MTPSPFGERNPPTEGRSGRSSQPPNRAHVMCGRHPPDHRRARKGRRTLPNRRYYTLPTPKKARLLDLPREFLLLSDAESPSLSEEGAVENQAGPSTYDEEDYLSSDGLSSVIDELDEWEQSHPLLFIPSETDEPKIERPAKQRRLSAYEYAARVYSQKGCSFSSPKPWFSKVFGVSPAKFRSKAKDLSVFDRALTLYVRMNWVMYTQLGLGWVIPGSRAPFPSSLRLLPSPRITGWELAAALRSTARRFKRSPFP